MDGSLYFASLKTGTALRLRVIGTVNHCNIAVGILLTSCTFHEICSHQANLIAGEHAEILFRRLFHEILPLNIKLPPKWNLPVSQPRILQIIGNIQHLRLAFRIIVNDQLHRIQNSHHTRLLKL